MSQMSPSDRQAAVDVSGIWITRYVGFSAFAILIWDHIITFPDEVKYIWKRPKKPVIYLFFINRYLIPLSFVVNLVAYTLQSWDQRLRELCAIRRSHNRFGHRDCGLNDAHQNIRVV
ncbi:hypothetical protein FIBSPDRAFT_177503 [Athelia psychrophila]|uniref:DUF6533 domain-containing protein n=1 Tax=Athelia psychrophila TaxID=1759441 RepID=A0A166SNL7_9AGAM|nr:hypothetical protein FIBSPDRAFT_177503 [Fibularhizoctonia sp. CBS 109695]